MAQNPSLKNAAMAAGLEQVLHYLEKDPETNIPKIMKLIDTVTPKDWYVKQRAGFRQAIEEKNNWYQLIMKVYELDPGVRQAFFRNFILNASLLGSARQGRGEPQGKLQRALGHPAGTPPRRATCTARAAGRRSTATGST